MDIETLSKEDYSSESDGSPAPEKQKKGVGKGKIFAEKENAIKEKGEIEENKNLENIENLEKVKSENKPEKNEEDEVEIPIVDENEDIEKETIEEEEEGEEDFDDEEEGEDIINETGEISNRSTIDLSHIESPGHERPIREKNREVLASENNHLKDKVTKLELKLFHFHEILQKMSKDNLGGMETLKENVRLKIELREREKRLEKKNEILYQAKEVIGKLRNELSRGTKTLNTSREKFLTRLGDRKNENIKLKQEISIALQELINLKKILNKKNVLLGEKEKFIGNQKLKIKNHLGVERKLRRLIEEKKGEVEEEKKEDAERKREKVKIKREKKEKEKEKEITENNVSGEVKNKLEKEIKELKGFNESLVKEKNIKNKNIEQLQSLLYKNKEKNRIIREKNKNLNKSLEKIKGSLETSRELLIKTNLSSIEKLKGFIDDKNENQNFINYLHQLNEKLKQRKGERSESKEGISSRAIDYYTLITLILKELNRFILFYKNELLLQEFRMKKQQESYVKVMEKSSVEKGLEKELLSRMKEKMKSEKKKIERKWVGILEDMNKQVLFRTQQIQTLEEKLIKFRESQEKLKNLTNSNQNTTKELEEKLQQLSENNKKGKKIDENQSNNVLINELKIKQSYIQNLKFKYRKLYSKYKDLKKHCKSLKRSVNEYKLKSSILYPIGDEEILF